MRRRFFTSTMSGGPHPYDALIEYATGQSYTLPSAPQQALQRAFVDALVAAGIWRKLDLLYVFATDGDSDFARINWINPGQFSATEGGSGSAVFTENEGFAGVTSTGWLDTGWIPSDHAVKMKANDASFFAHINNEQLTTTAAFGTGSSITQGDAVNSWLEFSPLNDVTSTRRFSINHPSASALGTTVDHGMGFHYGYNLTNGDRGLYEDGVDIYNTTGTSGTDLSIRSLNIFRRNPPAGVGAGVSEWQVSVLGIGASLPGKEVDLYNAWNTYFSSL